MPPSSRRSQYGASSTVAAVTLHYPVDGLVHSTGASSPSSEYRSVAEGCIQSEEERPTTVAYPPSVHALRRELRSIRSEAASAVSSLPEANNAQPDVARSRSPSNKNSSRNSASKASVSWHTPAESSRRSKSKSKHSSEDAEFGQHRIVPEETMDDRLARDELLQRAVQDSQLESIKRKANPDNSSDDEDSKSSRGRKRLDIRGIHQKGGGVVSPPPSSSAASPSRASARARRERPHSGASNPNPHFSDQEQSSRRRLGGSAPLCPA